jgi:hypothetical protein
MGWIRLVRRRFEVARTRPKSACLRWPRLDQITIQHLRAPGIEEVPPRYAASFARTGGGGLEEVRQQHRDNAAAAARDGFIIPDSPAFRFTEVAVGGLNLNRPELKRFLAAASSPTAPFIRAYVKDETRFARLKNPLVLREALRAARVSAHCSASARGLTTCQATQSYTKGLDGCDQLLRDVHRVIRAQLRHNQR